MKLVMDTSAYAELARGNSHLRHILETADEVLVPAVVLGELHAGFRGGTRQHENLELLRSFLSAPGVHVMPVDEGVAERYGDLVTRLRAQGTPIPTNDVWISAITLETGGRLLALDRHFDNVPGIMSAL